MTFQISLVDGISHLLKVIVMLIPHRGANVAMAHRIHDELKVFRGLIDERTVGVLRRAKCHDAGKSAAFRASRNFFATVVR